MYILDLFLPQETLEAVVILSKKLVDDDDTIDIISPKRFNFILAGIEDLTHTKFITFLPQ